jgi:hypothetical protein
MNWTLHEIPTNEREQFLRSLDASTLATTMNELAESTLTDADPKQNDSLCILANAMAAFAEIMTSKNLKQARSLAAEMLALMTPHIVAVVNTDDRQRSENARSRKGH